MQHANFSVKHMAEHYQPVMMMTDNESSRQPIVFYIGLASQMPVVMVFKYWFQTFSMLDVNHHNTFQMPARCQ